MSAVRARSEAGCNDGTKAAAVHVDLRARKKDQEEMTLLFGRTYDVPVVAMRYFNIYGTRQALSNPYTGVAAIFASRLLNQQRADGFRRWRSDARLC